MQALISWIDCVGESQMALKSDFTGMAFKTFNGWIYVSKMSLRRRFRGAQILPFSESAQGTKMYCPILGGANVIGKLNETKLPQLYKCLFAKHFRAYNSSPLPNGSADRPGHNNKQPLKYQKTSSIGSGEEIPLVKTESQPNANFNRNDSNTAIQLSTTSNHLQLPNGYPVPSSGEDECGNGLNQRSSFNLSASRSSPNSVPRVSSPLATKGKDGQMEPSRLLGRGSFSHLSTDSARGML